jgi:WhiB family transcriptional regulator, redox-sensing transcriptional regulator
MENGTWTGECPPEHTGAPQTVRSGRFAALLAPVTSRPSPELTDRGQRLPGAATPVISAKTAWFTVMFYAACADGALEPDAWFPVSQDPAGARLESADALALCRTCPVRALCLDLSLRHWTIGQHGIWGGTLPDERKALRDRRRSAMTGDTHPRPGSYPGSRPHPSRR